MINRIAAYVLIFIAGMAAACAGVAMFDGPDNLANLLAHPGTISFTYILYAGAAAVLAALLVHAPLLRAAHSGERPLLYAWALAGVFAAHAAYTVLVFLQVITSYRMPSLFAQLNIALSTGLVGFMLGVIPNSIAAIAFAEALKWLDEHRPAQAAGQTGAV